MNDTTIPNSKFTTRIITDPEGQPQILVISKGTIPLDAENVRDISTGAARLMAADNGKLNVYVKQDNGSFNLQPMEIFTEHRKPAARENGEPKQNLSSDDVENDISRVKGQFEEVAAAQTAEQIRQQYKKEQGIE